VAKNIRALVAKRFKNSKIQRFKRFKNSKISFAELSR